MLFGGLYIINIFTAFDLCKMLWGTYIFYNISMQICNYITNQ